MSLTFSFTVSSLIFNPDNGLRTIEQNLVTVTLKYSLNFFTVRHKLLILLSLLCLSLLLLNQPARSSLISKMVYSIVSITIK